MSRKKRERAGYVFQPRRRVMDGRSQGLETARQKGLGDRSFNFDGCWVQRNPIVG